MNTDKEAVDIFLRDVGMLPEAIDLADTVEHMLEEMKRGLEGEKSSLQMIPTYIDAAAVIPIRRKAVVLDAGGTNLRAAQVTFTEEDKPCINNFIKIPMPGTQGRTIGREEFFDNLAALVEPLLPGTESLGFCFSYPTEIFPDRDGRLIHWSKEIDAPEVEGRMIGTDLKDALMNRSVTEMPEIVVLNDTVATLLSGKSSNSFRPWGGYVGFILGTGTNSCYLESNSSISKIENNSGSQIINCESGNYAVQQRGEADLILAEKTSKSETYWLEKMLSGGYFGALATETALLAGRNGILSQNTFEFLEEVGEFSTKEADNYCHNPSVGVDNAVHKAIKRSGHSADAVRLWYIFDALLERAARLSAVNLAATVLKGPTGTGPLSPTCLTIDGTTYYYNYRFPFRVESYLRPFLSARNRYYETVRVEDAPLIGAAVAALTH